MVMHDYGVVDADYARQHGYRTPQAELEAERLAGAGGPTLREQYGIDDAWGLAMEQCGQQAGEQLRGGKGYAYDTPLDPLDAFPVEPGPTLPPLSEHEIAAAQAWYAAMADRARAVVAG
jgi:hypothetical protein